MRHTITNGGTLLVVSPEEACSLTATEILCQIAGLDTQVFHVHLVQELAPLAPGPFEMRMEVSAEGVDFDPNNNAVVHTATVVEP